MLLRLCKMRGSVSTLKLRTTPRSVLHNYYKNDGMGIELSVSRSIIENHHGRLWAAPNDGPGATFSFSIPSATEGLIDTESHSGQSDPGCEGPTCRSSSSQATAMCLRPSKP